MKCKGKYSLELDCFETRHNVDNILNTKYNILRTGCTKVELITTWKPLSTFASPQLTVFSRWQFPILPSCSGNIGIILQYNDSCCAVSAPAIPPAPINVMSSHPLLVRQPDGHPMGIQRRGRGRREASCRYNPTTQTLHVNLQRQPNPPVILQR